MLHSKERNAIKIIAHNEGITYKEVYKNMEFAILEAYNNPDLIKQANFKKTFGNKLPTPEQFINKILKISKGKKIMNVLK